MKLNYKLVFAFVATALVSFLAGSLCSFPLSSENALGEVGRVKKYTSNVVDIDTDNFQERLLQDSVFRASTLDNAQFMQIQANALAEYVGNNKEEVKVPCQQVANAKQAIDDYVEKLSELISGKKVKGFEQSYNNALLGYYHICYQYGDEALKSLYLSGFLNQEQLDLSIKRLSDQEQLGVFPKHYSDQEQLGVLTKRIMDQEQLEIAKQF